MKKYYSSNEYRERTIRIQRKLERLRKHRKQQEETNHKSERNNFTNYPTRANKKSGNVGIDVPTIFSVVENPDSMLSFFSQVHSQVKSRRSIFFDMSKIEKLGVDALLYMLSVFDYYENVHGFRKFSGNVPDDANCRSLLVSSGFLNYVHHGKLYAKERKNILSIKSHELVQPSIANQVVSFAIEKLGRADIAQARSIYATLIECMGNTRNHAYMPGRPHPKWWLIAAHNEENNRVNFTFLDNGQGIPETMKKEFQ
jgi:hypothetical protein